MEQYLGQFEVYLLTEKRAARNTVLAYLHDLRQFANYLAKRALVFEQLELTQLKAYLLYLRKNQALAARSLARKISALKVFY
ncbi:MAG TPA: site-specific integrase, partial [Candidatus Babeliales bacterium]|nr:site-specific integrase [Candidatus Babeliales bacterium]